MEAWTDLYEELAQVIINNIPEIEWVDLWHEQIANIEEELPFPTPAVFIEFNTNSCDDRGLLIQDCDTQIDFYLFFEALGDTYQGSYNKQGTVAYLHLLTRLHSCFHGVHGVNFGTMRRIDMRREETGGAGNLYRIAFSCLIEDASAQAEYDKSTVSEIAISKEPIERPSVVDDNPLFILP